MSEKIPERATVKELAEIMERSEKSVRECINAIKAKRGQDKKYQVVPIMEEHRSRQARNTRKNVDPNGEIGEPTTWSDKLKAKQVEKTDVQISILKKDLVPIDELNSELTTFGEIMLGAMEEFVQWVKVDTRDARQVARAKETRDRVKVWVQGKIESK